MRKLVVGSFVSLDGVVQAPGGPDEDREGGFEHGGWLVPFFDEKFGEIRVKDADGNEMIVFGRIQAGDKTPRQGERVVLVDYDAEKDLFWVAQSPDIES